MGRRIWLAGLAVTLVIAGIATTGGAREPRHQRSDKAKGLVFEGLERKANGACAGQYRIELGDRGAACTHGPDPAPGGIDVTEGRTVADITESTQQVTDEIGASGVWCTGNGADGSRVQAVYAVASDRPDRFADIAPLIATWAGQMDTVVNHSAAETGGERHIRFATSSDCVLDVAHVVLSPTGDDTLSNTITELRASGLNRSDRKYVIWADATVYCGIAQVGGGDTAGLTNGANKGPHYARVDSGCWGRSDHLSEVHELMHTLGAVQLSAPHSTGGYHCTDESDLMCYPDARGVTMSTDCPSAHEWLLDCNHDDYFHTSPLDGLLPRHSLERRDERLPGRWNDPGLTDTRAHPNDDDHDLQRLDLVETLQEDVRPHDRRRLGGERASVRVERWRRQGQGRRRRRRWNPDPAPASDRRQRQHDDRRFGPERAAADIDASRGLLHVGSHRNELSELHADRDPHRAMITMPRARRGPACAGPQLAEAMFSSPRCCCTCPARS